MCGGTAFSSGEVTIIQGLSPRVRGNRQEGDPEAVLVGSIPACAGEPSRGWARWLQSAVYPRVCGGTCAALSAGGNLWGLSPRVRGNLRRLPVHPHQHGSIPACAGEPSRARGRRAAIRVYPRVCGGTGAGPSPPADNHGLSPRVRGNRCLRVADRAIDGSIPACAGEPRGHRSGSPRHGVYPRVCGGTSKSTRETRSPRGLSPRVRGNLTASLSPVPEDRSIPACAGEPRPPSGRPRCPRVYPRVCGGTTEQPKLNGTNRGLSPRVRGNPRRVAGVPGPPGSIPACAGEPASAA